MQFVWAIHVEGSLADDEPKLYRNRQPTMSSQDATASEPPNVVRREVAGDRPQILSAPAVSDHTLDQGETPISALEFPELDTSCHRDRASRFAGHRGLARPRFGLVFDRKGEVCSAGARLRASPTANDQGTAKKQGTHARSHGLVHSEPNRSRPRHLPVDSPESVEHFFSRTRELYCAASRPS
jgi:hypothetical protein